MGRVARTTDSDARPSSVIRVMMIAVAEAVDAEARRAILGAALSCTALQRMDGAWTGARQVTSQREETRSE